MDLSKNNPSSMLFCIVTYGVIWNGGLHTSTHRAEAVNLQLSEDLTSYFEMMKMYLLRLEVLQRRCGEQIHDGAVLQLRTDEDSPDLGARQ